MKRILISAFCCMAVCISAFCAPPVVKTGTLPNGLTYYIMHNEEPKGQADFFLAQSTGSIHEKENERGLAHFLEHMAFNGSKHFPGNTLISYLESIGVKFGADLNAYTSTDETVYNISRVPTSRQGSLDSCLLILHDWSNALSLNDSDINSERGVIEGEWRHRRSASNRILEQLLPRIYPGSLYGKRMPIGLMSVVRNFKPQTLRDFYHREHRPSRQAVIVVGDFDPVKMESKVREMFGGVAEKSIAKDRGGKHMAVPDNKKMIVAIGSDPEQGHNVIQLHFKHQRPQLSGEDYWRRQVGEDLMVAMLVGRFDSLERKPDCAWQSMGLGIGKFLMSRSVNSLMLRAIARQGKERETFAAWYAEILRVLDHGFTTEEIEIAKSAYMSTLAKRRRTKDDSNTAYARRWSRHYLDGGPLIGMDAELDSLQAVIGGMTPEYCTALLTSMADSKGSGRNMVVVNMRPDKGEMPSVRNFMTALESVNNMELAPYTIQPITGPLLANEPARGSIVGRDTVEAIGARLITLGNGIKVYAKKTDFKTGQFFMVGKGNGGFSQRYDASLAAEMKMLNDVMPLCRYGRFSQSQLRRLLEGRDIEVRTSVSNTDESVSLSAGPDDREDAFRLLYLKLTDVSPDPDNFAVWQASTAERLAGQSSSPVQLMGDSIHANVYNHHPLGVKESASTVRALRLDTIVDLYRDRYSDLSDFTFYVTGDFEWDALEDLLSRYIATLPAAGRVEMPRDIDYRYTPGRRELDFSVAMETPTAIAYSFLNGPAEYNIKNYLTATISGQILKSRLLKELREEKGWTYSVTSHCSINPDLNGSDSPSFLWPVYVKTSPEHASAARQAVEDAYTLLANEDPTVEEIEKVRSYLAKNYKEGLSDNGFWLSAMQKYNEYGLDFGNDYAEALQSITPADIRRFTLSAIGAHRTRLTLTPR